MNNNFFFLSPPPSPRFTRIPRYNDLFISNVKSDTVRGRIALEGRVQCRSFPADIPLNVGDGSILAGANRFPRGGHDYSTETGVNPLRFTHPDTPITYPTRAFLPNFSSFSLFFSLYFHSLESFPLLFAFPRPFSQFLPSLFAFHFVFANKFGRMIARNIIIESLHLHLFFYFRREKFE